MPRCRAATVSTSPGVLEAETAQDTFQEWPQLETAQLLLDASTIYPIHPQWTRVVDALLPALEAIMSGADAEQELNNAARQAERALRR